MKIIEDARELLSGAGSDPWPPKQVALGLQGGGSFGAFTWGVLERLLEAPDVGIESISGASAGAVNGVLLASGLVRNGREGARENLAKFWQRMTDEAAFLAMTSMPDFLAATSAAFFTRAFSPAQLNPFDLNPLRNALEAIVDFDTLRDPRAPKLLVATTRVRDGSLRIFRNDELTTEVVLASACLPLIHRTVTIEGEPYWDGAYVANPPVLQLIHESAAHDVLIVQVTPSHGERAPTSPSEIGRRLDQITFNSALNTELAALDLACKLQPTAKLLALRLVRIAAEDEVAGLANRDASDLGRTFIDTLHRSGRAAAERWLARTPQEVREVA